MKKRKRKPTKPKTKNYDILPVGYDSDEYIVWVW